jgi:DNA processing protein
VFAVPGDATQPASFGPNQLIKQGAKLVTGWEDVVEELPTPIRAELLPVETTDGERTPYALLEVDKSRHVDELVVGSKMNSSELLSALFEREMKGLVQQLPGKQFLKGML